MSLLFRPVCWSLGHTWRWIGKKTQECSWCGMTRVVE